MATTKKLRYSADEDQQAARWEAGADAEYDDLPPPSFEEVADSEYEHPADPDYDDSPQADYDEPAAQPDYDQPADPDYGDELPALPEAEPSAPPLVRSPAAGFTYALGRAVLPLTQQQPSPVVWRGYLRERHPVTGLVHRVNVYRLNDGYWDCYREEELQAA